MARRSWAAAAAVLVGAGTIAVASRSPDAPMPSPPPAAANDATDVGQLRREVALLRGAVARGPAVAHAPAAVDAPPPPDEAPVAPEALIADQTMLVEDRLAAGDPDPSWSSDATRLIHDRFAQAGLTGARLDAAACRGTLCKIQLRFESAEALAAVAGDAADSVPWTASGFVRSDPDDPLRLVVYASREGTRLPHPDQL